MRLTTDQVQVIKTTIQATAALQEPPLQVRAIRLYGSPKVDLLLQAPNLAMLPIHAVAQREGVLL